MIGRSENIPPVLDPHANLRRFFGSLGLRVRDIARKLQAVGCLHINRQATPIIFLAPFRIFAVGFDIGFTCELTQRTIVPNDQRIIQSIDIAQSINPAAFGEYQIVAAFPEKAVGILKIHVDVDIG